MTKLTDKIIEATQLIELPKLIPPLRRQGNNVLNVKLFRSPKKSQRLCSTLPDGSTAHYPQDWSTAFARDDAGRVWAVDHHGDYKVRQASTADIRALAAVFGVSQRLMAQHVDSLRISQNEEWEQEQYEQIQRDAATYGFKLVRDLSAPPEKQIQANKIRARVKRK